MSDDQGQLTLEGMAAATAAMRDEDDKVRAVLALVRSAIASGLNERVVFSAVYGDETGGEYWASFLRRAMTEAELIRALATHLASPARLRGRDDTVVAMANLPTPRVTRAIEALPSALRIGDTSAYPTEIVRALAAKSSPALPRSLLDFIAPAAVLTEEAKAKRKPGTKPTQRDALKESMRRWIMVNSPEALRGLPLDAVMAEFGTNRNLTWRARKEVLSEFAVRDL